jgi:hypothetical protein
MTTLGAVCAGARRKMPRQTREGATERLSPGPKGAASGAGSSRPVTGAGALPAPRRSAEGAFPYQYC